MSDCFIYHPGSGTMIPLSDTVYIIDATDMPEETLDLYEAGAVDVFDAMYAGVRLDNDYWEMILDEMEPLS